MAEKTVLKSVYVDGGPVWCIGKAYSGRHNEGGSAAAVITDIDIRGNKLTLTFADGSQEVIIGGVISARYVPEPEVTEPMA